MTTAHRPTWAPAKGGEEQGGNRLFAPSRALSAKDMPGQMSLKYRGQGQASIKEVLERDLRAELQEKEANHYKKDKDILHDEQKKDLLVLEAALDREGGGRSRILAPKALDADDDSEAEESDESDDDEDDEAALLAELDKIKKERAEEARKADLEAAKEKEKAMEEEMVKGNPLLVGQLAGNPSFQVKRRWDEDVPFKNQARGEPKAQKRFINDTIRNDFHRRFLSKYIK